MSADGTRVPIAGGGVAALEAALALRALAQDRVTVELLSPETHFWYRPLAVAEPFGLGDVRRFELSELAAAAGASFTLGSLVGVDVGDRVAETSPGGAVGYDALVVACGGVPTVAVPGALTFRGPAEVERIRRLLDELAAGDVRRVAFAVPGGAVWSLPAYELALLTSAYLATRAIHGVELLLVTPEEEPLQLFGAAAVDAVRDLLDERGVTLQTAAYPAEFVDGELLLTPSRTIAADRVVALPRLRGPRIEGLPQTLDRFLPVDPHCRVRGRDDVFAAGDITTFPVKQGGIAAQQADAVAEAIAASAGADVDARPFRPVLRGLLLTGHQPRYLRRGVTDVVEETSLATTEPLWWPPAKIVGRYLAPFLAGLAGVEAPPETRPAPGAVPVEVELDPADVDRLAARGVASVDSPDAEAERTVVDVMTTDPLVVAPESTLDDVAQQMRERDVGSAAVAASGRLVGILTSRDLLRALAGGVHSGEARVSEWMTAEPVAVPATTTLDAAVALMTEYGIHHLAVVEGDRPLGMIELAQAARYAVRRTGIGLGF